MIGCVSLRRYLLFNGILTCIRPVDEELAQPKPLPHDGVPQFSVSPQSSGRIRLFAERGVPLSPEHSAIHPPVPMQHCALLYGFRLLNVPEPREPLVVNVVDQLFPWSLPQLVSFHGLLSSELTVTNNPRWPKPIPVDTSIPSWAFLDIVPVNNLDVQAAQAVAEQGAPESSATPSPTATASSTATITASKKSDVRPIVGGVIGGLGGAAILAGIVTFFILRHRRKSRTAPSAAFVPTPTNPEYSEYSLEPYNREKPYDPSVQYHAPLLMDALPSPLSVNTSMPSTMTLYDPSDPSTFPSSAPLASLGMSSHLPGPYSPNLSARQHAARKYNGVPEV